MQHFFHKPVIFILALIIKRGMKKAGTERNSIILAILIVLAVGISGFLVHKSLTQIVNSIHDEASTGLQLIVIKDISLNLLELENSIQLYTLTNDKSDLENYEIVNKRLKQRISFLANLPGDSPEDAGLNDSIRRLVETKLGIWEEIKEINTVKRNPRPQFDELYSMLEYKEIDTIRVEVVVPPEEKKGILKKIFGKKDTATTRIDTTFVERTVENEEIKEEIEELESGLKRQERRKNKRELELIEQNILVSGKLNHIIAEIEKAERDSLIEKNDEADRLATTIYKRLSSFSVMAVILLFLVLLLFVRYLWKARKVEKALTAAKLGAERLAKAKEVFMANVSHEMRTPVNAIYGLTEQLLQEETRENVTEKLGILQKSSQHLKEVVNDTLDFSKIQANKLKLTNTDFAPESVVREIITLLEPEAAAKNIDLIYQCHQALPVALVGDPFRLKQVLINIIGNAIKFTEEGSVTLIAEAQKTNNGQCELKYQVKDTGIGISEENLELIFDDFVQIETDYTRKFGGTGLGLSIVKKLIEMQNGKITIESKLEQGTAVSFYIPYQLGNPEKIDRHMQQELSISEEVRSLKILGVDDDEYNRYLLKVIFDKWGLVNYCEAKNGRQAVKMARENNFDLILMDLRMPLLNGIEASREIIIEKPDSKIIALATINSEAEMKMCTDAGMKQSLSKPFAEQELLKAIVAVLNLEIKEKPESGDYDLRELERLANGDQSFIKEMVEIFIRSAQSGVKNIRLALQTEDWHTISEAAHKMAAPCKHIQADDLYADLKRLESVSVKQESQKQILELICSVEQKVERITSSLSAIMEL